MPQTIAAPAATAHPVLVELVQTRLVWVKAETPERAEQLAATYADAPGLENLPLVDDSASTRIVTEPLADWLDTDPDQVERLDADFAAKSGPA